MIEIIIQLLIFLVGIFLAGYFRGWQDRIWFKSTENKLYRFAMRHPVIAAWYSGHKSIFDALNWTHKYSLQWLRYDPRFLLLCDPWHLAKKLEMLSVTISFAAFISWWALIYYIFYGAPFYYSYHYIQPISPDGNFWHFLISIFHKHHSRGKS